MISLTLCWIKFHQVLFLIVSKRKIKYRFTTRTTDRKIMTQRRCCIIIPYFLDVIVGIIHWLTIQEIIIAHITVTLIRTHQTIPFFATILLLPFFSIRQ